MKLESIIIKPVLTEKTVKLAGKGKYTFIVDPRANKNQIKEAFRKVYEVSVGNIKTSNKWTRRKRVFQGRSWGLARSQKREKKAIVEIKEGKDRLAKLFKF